ncbi:hypothetical protein OIU79_009501 [Salix purpurea]|uniref:Uncharacterized protein n=1 Tax=Salix purpurea TaxID=77065 RepID=A0A9Q0TKY5_SALPP|nr:hypothetical protein OIU79_009501 [Salix purpurea]
MIQEKKAKQQQLKKQVWDGKPSDEKKELREKIHSVLAERSRLVRLSIRMSRRDSCQLASPSNFEWQGTEDQGNSTTTLPSSGTYLAR